MKTVKLVLVLVFVAFACQQADAYICCVPDSSPTIQGCINAVSNGHTVLADAGTYYEKIEVLSADVADMTERLGIYYGLKDEILKFGIMDIYGEHVIQPGKGNLMTLTLKGTDLASLEISNVILVDEHGNMFEASVTEKVEMSPSRPAIFSLAQNYPNPLNPETQISYTLPERCQVKLIIYNVRGQRVRVLVDESQAAGHNTVLRDGKNQDGQEVASGIYFYRLEAGVFNQTRSMVLLK